MLFCDVRDNMYLTDGWIMLEVISRRIAGHSPLSPWRILVCLDALTERLVEVSELELAGYWELQPW